MNVVAQEMPVQLFRPLVPEDAVAAAADVLRSGWIGLGPKTEDFEKEFARFAGSPHCVGLSSCTAALHLALRVLDLPPGSEVITTPITFVSTNHAILYEGLTPAFADVERYTGNIDVGSVETRITPNTRAIIAVHYGGYPCDLDSLYGVARRHGLAVIEDCAHACGAVYRGRRIGGIGDLHAFSFHAVKNLAMGTGGALTLASAERDARLRKLRWMGIDKDTYRRSDGATNRAYAWEYDVFELGYKYHMNDVEAAIGLVQLRHLEAGNARRREIADIYHSELAGVPGIRLLQYEPDRVSSRHLCCVLAEERDRLVDRLREANVGVGVHYKRNDQYPMYREQDLPNAEFFAARTMSLPLHLYLTDEDVLRVCELIRGGW